MASPLCRAAKPPFLGVTRERDEFEFIYPAILSVLADTSRTRLPLLATDEFQTVELRSIKAPGRRKILFLPLLGGYQQKRGKCSSPASY